MGGYIYINERCYRIFFLLTLVGILHCTSSYSYAQAVLKEKEKIEISRLSSRDEAERLATRLQESGYETLVQIVPGKDKRPVFRVFALMDKGGPFDQRKILAGLASTAATTKTQGTTSARNLTWDDFETKGSYVHGSLTVTGLYTDNAFNTRKNKKSNFTLFLSPEIWVNLPRIDQKSLPSLLSPRAPGGKDLSSLRTEQDRKIQTFLHYGTEIPLTRGSSPYKDDIMHRLTGSFRYNGNRLVLVAGDQFEKNYHEREAGIITKKESDVFTANLASIGMSYHIGSRLMFGASYANFLVNYKAKESRFRNRADNMLSASAHYKTGPKSSLFAEYELLDVAYDKSGTLDSREHHIFGGADWEITAKSRGKIRAGYGTKNYSGTQGNNGNLILEGQLDHKLTPRSSIGLNVYRKTDESNIAGYAYTLTTGTEARLSYIVTAKTSLALRLGYIRDNYRKGIFAETPGSVKSTINQAGIDFTYDVRRWLKANIGYLFTKKTADVSDLEYTNNTWFFRVQASL